jgi:uncharacterized protein YjbJ (UPF0337 family)
VSLSPPPFQRAPNLHTHDLGEAPRQEYIVSFLEKAKNKAQELSGKGKEKTGRATGDRDLQARGKKDQTSGNAKQAGQKIKDIFK